MLASHVPVATFRQPVRSLLVRYPANRSEPRRRVGLAGEELPVGH
jgi:hypothetical protein